MSDDILDPLTHPQFESVRARLSLDKELPTPPAGLAMRTVSRLAELLVNEQTIRNETVVVPSTMTQKIVNTDSPVFFGRRRADLMVAAAIGFLAFGLSITGIQKLRAEAAIRHCQNTLREIHHSLSGYADVHQGYYPTVGGSAGPQAGDFAGELARTGFMPAHLLPVCPADDSSQTRQVGYTYTLGFRSPNGNVVGFRRPDPNNGDQDGVPMLADFPAANVAPAGGLLSPHTRGQNVLFAGGFVRFSTSAAVGLDGDDIYRNAAGKVGAGLSPNDVCLGRPLDRP